MSRAEKEIYVIQYGGLSFEWARSLTDVELDQVLTAVIELNN